MFKILKSTIEIAKWELKRVLSSFYVYRKRKGGTWYRVRPKYDMMYASYWINRKPFYNEVIIERQQFNLRSDDLHAYKS